MEDLCRICARVSDKYVHIYSRKVPGACMCDVIHELCRLHVSSTDGLPEYVCRKCYRTLMEFKEFRITCAKGQATLKWVRMRCKQELEKHNADSTHLHAKPFEVFRNVDGNSPLAPEVDIHSAEVDALGFEGGGEMPSRVITKMEERSEQPEDCNTSPHFLPIKIEEMKTDEESGDAVSGKSGQLYLNDSVCGIPQTVAEGQTKQKQSINLRVDGESSTGTSFLGVAILGKDRMRAGSSPANENCGDVRIEEKGDLPSAASTPLWCGYCGKSYSSKGNLKTHIQTHSGKKRFRCRVCMKYFSTKGNLKTHSRIHSGEKPYRCQLCDERFTMLSQLQYHAVHHTGQRPFECNLCGKRFWSKGILKTHTRTHV